MPNAERITDRIPGKAGVAYGYRLDEPYAGIDYLIVSCIDMPTFGLRETRIIPAEMFDGRVIMQTDGENTLSVSIPLPLCSHEEALGSIGYDVIEMSLEEAPPGDPDMKIEPTPEVGS